MVDTKEFGEALIKVVGSTGETNEVRARAEQVGQLCQKSGGRRSAAELITNLAFDRS